MWDDLHPIVCEYCGKSALIPVKPETRSPLLCQECYRKFKLGIINATQQN